MAVHKKYEYKLLRQTKPSGATPAEGLEDEMNELGKLGYRYIGEIESGPRVVMELEGIATDAGTPGAFQAAGLKVKGKK